MEIKHAVFAELDAATPGHAILASNTSGLSITEIGDATNRPDKVVGFHFFWPASYMRLIEVIEGEDTSPETAQAAANFAQAIRKMPVRCDECPGFVVNRILDLHRERDLALPGRDGRSTSRQLDKFITEQGPMPMGPFRVADMTGLDTVAEGRAGHARRLRRPLLRAPRHGGSSSRPATSAPRAGRASMSTPETDARRSTSGSPTASSSRRSSRPAWCSRRASRASATSTSG